MPRQVDVLAEGSIVGQQLRVVGEAKCKGRAVAIGAVDEFVGKLLDLGADRGVLYAAGGFTEGAIRRADCARHPRIALVHVKPDPVVFYDSISRITQAHQWEIAIASIIKGPRVSDYPAFLRGDGFLYID